jgi:DNA-directed RNA polymerase subunit N (RpoN/RPB10)
MASGSRTINTVRPPRTVYHFTCTKCSYEARYESCSYDYVLHDGTRLYVILDRAWCHTCCEVVAAEYLLTIDAIDRELRAGEAYARVFVSADDREAQAEVRRQLLRRRELESRRSSPARCLTCGSTKITPHEPYQAFIHPGCGGELHGTEITRPTHLEIILCDTEGRRITNDQKVV